MLEGSGASVDDVSGGGLKLIYYGREDAVIRRQLLVLPAGRYTFGVDVNPAPTGTAGGNSSPSTGLVWQVACADGGALLGSLPLNGGTARRVSLTFAVPAGCPAQWLSLRGMAGEFGEPIALTVSGLSLAPGQAS